jgi:hypothetical protein
MELLNLLVTGLIWPSVSYKSVYPMCNENHHPMLPKLLLTAFAAGALCVAPCIDARKMTKHLMKAKQLEAAKLWQPKGAFKEASGGVKNITFSNPKASGKYRTYYCCGR